MQNVTSSMEHYLRAIYELSFGNIGVRVSDIADKLGITKASTCIAMRNMQKIGLVSRDNYRLVHLTEEGKQQAIIIVDKFNIIRCFLVEILHIDPTVARHDACAMEHVLSKETICSMCKQLNYMPRKCKCSGRCKL